jgi:hypothetical protein
LAKVRSLVDAFDDARGRERAAEREAVVFEA